MTGAEVTLVEAGPAHAAVLAAVQAECLDQAWHEPGWNAADWAELLAMPGTFALLASVLGSAPIGFALARTVADEAELIAIGVHPRERRRHIGRALLDTISVRAKAGGAAQLFLEVAESNLAALSLYRQAGFTTVGRRANYYSAQDGSHDALVLRLSLWGERT